MIQSSLLPTSTFRITRAFSLIEVLVTITIVTLITAIIMVRYSSFDSSILLNNQAYEIALDLRETQVRSISVQADGTDEFQSGFGLYFNSATPDEYILFQDTNNDNRYNANETTLTTLTLDSRFTIQGIYINNSFALTARRGAASVVFKRPNFDANIRVAPNNSSVINNAVIQTVYLQVASTRDTSSFKSIAIYSSGQISVE